MKKHLLFLIVLIFATASIGSASILTVGAGGTYATIQAAINAAVPYDVINVAPGTYIESNITVNVSNITIQGVGATRDDVIVVPAGYDANIDNAFTSAQNGFIIKAHNVTIKKLTINGNGNALLTLHGNNYRAGIVTLDASQIGGGSWNNLHVDNVYIKYVWRRGISVFPRSVTGTLIENSRVEYVAYNQGMYLAGHSQVVNNTVKHCFQGIVQNPDATTPVGLFKMNNNTLTEIGNFTNCFAYPSGQPRAIQFDPVDPIFSTVEIKNNVIDDLGSAGTIGTVGIYTRRASSSSIVENNTITLSSGTSHSSGSQAVGMILGWSYANGFAARINHVAVSGYGLGILIFGTGTSTNPMILEGNVLTSTLSLRTSAGDGTGIYVANQYLFGATNKTESYVIVQNHNSISGFQRGVDVEKLLTSTQPITVIANNNSISGNIAGSDASTLTAPIDVTNNWWGNASGPYHATLNPLGTGNPVSNFQTFIPWWCDAGMTTKCSPLIAGKAIMNLSTGIQYTAAELAVALSAALTGQTLFMAGTVTAANVNISPKTITIVGNGMPGGSVIDGASILTSGNLIVKDVNFTNTTNAATIAVNGGTLKLRNCIITETLAGTQACLDVAAGTVDAGTVADNGLNKFIVNGPGSAYSNTPAITQYAIGNDWGSPSGPAIASNTTPGTGGAIVGTNKDLVIYSPWGGIAMSGYFNYYNVANTALVNGITVKLYQNNNQVGSDYTVTGGTYSFSNLVIGTYEIRTTSTKPTAGSVNSTDAAQVNYWPIAPYSIEKVRFYAGDVTGETRYLNATDAQRIQKNFVYGTAFDRPSWTFWEAGQTISTNPVSPLESYPVVTISASNKTANIYGLCTGDFNRSFTPAKKSTSSSVDLIYAGNKQVSSSQEFELPIRLVNSASVGAVSLVLNFPANLVEVMNVTMNSAGGQLDWTVNGSELRIGWNSQVPSAFGALDNLLTLRLKTTEAFKPGTFIRIELASDPLNELANDRFEAISNAILSVDVVEASPYGIGEQSQGNGLNIQNYPNPFAGSTTISYILPFNGKVVLEIRNSLGKTVKIITNEMQTVGAHSCLLDAGSLSSGLYTATIKLSSSTDELIKTIKLVISR